MRSAIEKVGGGFVEERELAGLDKIEVDIGGGTGEIGETIRSDPAPFRKEFEADEVGIAGEC